MHKQLLLGALMALLGLHFSPVFGAGVGENDPAQVTFVDQSRGFFNPKTQQLLRESPAWQHFLQKNGNWWVQFDEYTGFPHRAYGQPIAWSQGAGAEQAALSFLDNQMAAFGLPVGQLADARVIKQDAYTLVKFTQRVAGLPILWSQVSVRFNQQGEVTMFGLDAFPNVAVDQQGVLSAAQLADAAQSGIQYAVERVELGDRAILPVPAEEGLVYRVVQQAEVHTRGFDNMPGAYYTLVDAHTGTVWYRINTIHHCAPAQADATLTGDIVDNPLRNAINRALPELMVVVGPDTFYTDTSGIINLPNLTQKVAAQIYLAGRHAKVVNAQTGQVPMVTDSLQPGNNVIDLSGKVLATELAGYYHTDLVHDHMKTVTDGGFVQMDTAFQVNVELTTGTCNAFYNGVSINFYAQGGGCPATALFSDVVYHEYGHGINYEYYDYWGGFANNGALQEGYADVWGFSITEDPILGQGFQGSANTFVRRYDINPKVYPQDLVGQVHADGEIIAGAFWDTYRNLGNDMDKMLALFVAAQVNTPIAPSGAEGQLYSDILLEVMLADDDDGNLANGTPHDSAIIDGFAKHGISLLANAQLSHNEPLVAAANADVELEATLTTSLSTYLGDVLIRYRTDRNASYQEQVMSSSGAINYRANLGPIPEGTVVDYFFVVTDAFGTEVVSDPIEANTANDPNLPYFLTVGFEQQELEDFDVQFGAWSIDPFGDDNATTGAWEIDAPIPTFDNANNIVQTNQDRTPNNSGNLCAFTGNAAGGAMGTNDVDRGKTTLLSPEFDLTNAEKPAFSYWRWFINDPAGGANPGNDPWQVFISDDGLNWVRVERTFTADRSWRQNVILVEDFVQKTSTVSLMFVAQDSLIPGTNLDGGSIVEAAVDDLALLDLQGTATHVEFPDHHFSIQPNPAQQQATLRWKGVVERIELVDVAGRVWQQERPGQQGLHVLSTGQLSNGMYWINFYTPSGRIARPLLIHR